MFVIRNWQGDHEDHNTRKLKHLYWYACSNDLAGDTYTQIVDHPEGLSHWGMWSALLMVASKVAGPRSGQLIRDNGQAHTVATLARLTRAPEILVATAIERFVGLDLIYDVKSPENNSTGRMRENAGESPDTQLNSDQPPPPTLSNSTLNKSTQLDREVNGNARAESAPEKLSKKTLGGGGEPQPKPPKLPAYETPADALKAFYQQKMGESIQVKLLDTVRGFLGGEITQAFVDALAARTGIYDNFAGFLHGYAKDFLRNNTPAGQPVSAEDAAKRVKCSLCGSIGGGMLMVPDRPVVFCECASAEYRAAMLPQLEDMNRRLPKEKPQ